MSEPSVERDPFEEVAEGFLARYRLGERPSINDLAARHPELADQIRDLLPALVLVEQDLTIDPEVGSSRAAALPAGSRQLGDYRLLREIGRGGMGVVYEAEQVSLGRRVALKVLAARVTCDGNALERFRREAKAAARLHHTNIVPVFDVGNSGDVAYFAMQFIQGQGLDQVIVELRRLDDTEGKSIGIDWTAAGRLARRSTTGPRTQGAASRSQDAKLGLVAELLLSARLEAGGLEPFAAGGTAEPTLLDPAEHTTADARGERLSPVTLTPTPAASTSAVLPGGTSVSMIGSAARRQPFFRSVAQIGRQAAQGLAHAHARGIIHRDIKPSNLLLDTSGVVWIADFGLAKADDDGLTATGDVIGTIRYMAPERFRGDGDARADVYALGLTLYELMTLRPAHESSDRLRLIERIKAEEPARPRSLDDRIPRDLETIILKAIEKDPARRYATADAMAEDLRRFLSDEPIQARRASAAERYARWARHHRTAAAIAAVLAAVLVVSTAASVVVAARMADLAAKEKNAAAAERTARAAAEAETYRATLSEVKALRAGREPGWRELALDELARLAVMPTPRRDLPELRTEAAAALGTPDVRLVARIAPPGKPSGSFAFSPDGRTLVTADKNAGLDFWDVPGNRHLSSAEGYAVIDDAGARDTVAYLSRGEGVAVATQQGVSFTDQDGVRSSRAPIVQRASKPTNLTMSADGRRIAIAWTGSAGITVHNARNGDLLARFKDANANFGLSADGEWIARQEGADIVLRPIASREQSVLLGRYGVATTLALSPSGAVLAAAIDHTFASASDHTTVLFDVAKREQLGVLRGHRGRVTDVDFSPDGEWIATGSYDFSARIWEARTGQNVAILRESAQPVHSVKWSPTGDYLAASNSDEIMLFKVAGRRRVRQWLTGQRVEHSRVAAHPHRAQLATAGFSELDLWDLSASRPSPQAIGPNPGDVHALAYSPDGSFLAQCNGLELLIRDVQSSAVQCRFALPAHADALAFDPSGMRIATGDYAGNVIVWDLAAKRRLQQFTTGSVIWSMAFLDDPRRVVAHDRDSLLLFGVDSGNLERKIELAGGGVQRFVYDRTRGRLIVGFQSGSIGAVRLADFTRGPRLENAHDGAVACIALSPDARLMASAGADRRVVLRDAETFETLLSFPLPGGTPMNLTFDSAGRRLAIVGTGEDIEVWDLHALRDGLGEIGLAWDRTGAGAAAPTSRAGPDGEHLPPVVPVIRRPGVPDPAAFEQASRLVRSGFNAVEGGRWADAIGDLQRAKDQLGKLLKTVPGDGRVASQLGVALGGLGRAFGGEGRLREAKASYEEARQFLESVRQPSFVDSYNIACVYAMLSSLADHSGASSDSAGREELASRAMASLRRSLGAGMNDFALMDRDPELDPLRKRPDFRSLMVDRGFPSDPFTNPSPLSPRERTEESLSAELVALSAAVDRRPSEFAVHYARGQYFARRRDWPRALADFRKALELHPPESWADENGDTWFGFTAGLVLLQSDDREGHRRIARAMLEKFAASDQSSTRDRTAKINVIAEPQREDLEKISELAERSVQLGQASSSLCWLQLTRGMASYRSADFTAAVSELRLAEGGVLDDLSLAVARYYVAMAEHQLGRAVRAKSLFNAVSQTLDTTPHAQDWGNRWPSALEVDIVRREAEALIFRGIETGAHLGPLQSAPPSAPDAKPR
jgi:eukaryotic-like serine/threonine-protein kinase